MARAFGATMMVSGRMLIKLALGRAFVKNDVGQDTSRSVPDGGIKKLLCW